MFNEVIFDLETKSFYVEGGKFDPSKFGVSIVAVYARRLDENFKEIEGKMLSFWEEEFSEMWKYFGKADRIIGFNSIGFDIPALGPYSPSGFSKLTHFDILDEIKKLTGHKTSLHKIARATLGIQKTDLGENAILYWERHDPKSLELLQKYCRDDVQITKDIYDYALKNKKLLFNDYWNNPREIEVDFSYSKADTTTPQPSLF